jgi:pimeloyl-ACP methyl ester carboxylesterase
MPTGEPRVPVLVLTPRHDQFSPPEATAATVGAWRHAELEVIESADHFLAGHTVVVAERVTSWLAATAR